MRTEYFRLVILKSEDLFLRVLEIETQDECASRFHAWGGAVLAPEMEPYFWVLQDEPMLSSRGRRPLSHQKRRGWNWRHKELNGNKI